LQKILEFFKFILNQFPPLESLISNFLKPKQFSNKLFHIKNFYLEFALSNFCCKAATVDFLLAAELRALFVVELLVGNLLFKLDEVLSAGVDFEDGTEGVATGF
jgi:hypothetical protein